MQASTLYAKLKTCFPNDIENINIPQLASNFLDQSQALSFIISSNLPQLSLDQVHNLCRRQEKNVMEKILQVKKIDLYQQIAQVCPSQKDLKSMPVEEVTAKINQFAAKMALEERIKEESEEEMDSPEQSYQNYSEGSEELIQPMQIDDLVYEHPHSMKGLQNIFEEEYNAHLPWNQMCIYDLN